VSGGPQQRKKCPINEYSNERYKPYISPTPKREVGKIVPTGRSKIPCSLKE